MFDNESVKSVYLKDEVHQPSQSKSDSQNLDYKQRCSNFQSFNKFPDVFDLFVFQPITSLQ